MTTNSKLGWFLASIVLVPVADYAQTISDPPEAHSPITLAAVNDSKTGRGAFSYQGREEAPVIRAMPGSSIRITYKNEMSSASTETCVSGPCMNMTNLHFHGLHVSPNAPQDDVLTMMAMPGQTLEYKVEIPGNQPPGLYWYHTHPHGESYQQSLDGMSGAIVVEGLDAYVPEIRKLRERILVLRDRVLDEKSPDAKELRETVSMPVAQCGASTEEPERLFTVNGALRPQIPIAPDERQFWRIVNASPDLYADLQIDGAQFEVVALDGMPLAFHDPTRRSKIASHVLVPPAGRVEVIVTGPSATVHAKLRTRCFDTGSAGDPNPEMVLADLVGNRSSADVKIRSRTNAYRPVFEAIASSKLVTVERSSPTFTVLFTEHDHGFFINGKAYTPSAEPMLRVQIGGYERWRVVNDSDEVHPFHIHQVHFLAYAENGKQPSPAEWLDTVNVPARGSVDLVMDFSDPIIRGMSLFHCHLLQHEDKGMMAKILFE
jgi:suppressor of ftsI